MHFIKIVAAALSVVILAASAQSTISTYAGRPPLVGPALSVPLPLPDDIKADANGNLYICLSVIHIVYKLDTSGNLTVIAGTGAPGFSGDNGPATSARLFAPVGLALDELGNLYIADFSNLRVRKVVLATGIISTVAGNGNWQYCYPSTACYGDGGPATDAFVLPRAVGVDRLNNLYIAEDFAVRKVTGITITRVAGTGGRGEIVDGVPATQAAAQPSGIAFDPSNNLYIADQYNNVVRKVTNGVISTFAGGTRQGANPGDGGPATNALITPVSVACDGSGNVYFAEPGRVRKVTAGIISTLNFTGAMRGFTVDFAGNVHVIDSVQNRILRIAAGGPIAVAGNGQYYFNGDNIPATTAVIDPRGWSMALDADGSLYFADTDHRRIRKISGDGTISTVAGTGTPGFSGDNGPAVSAQLNNPTSVAIDNSGRIYIADGNKTRAIDRNGTISTVAMESGFSLTVDKAGSVYYATGASIRKITNGTITTVLGTAAVTDSRTCDTGPAASFAFSRNAWTLSIAVAPDGDIYFSTPGCIRRLKNGMVERVAGGDHEGYGGDGGPAISASFGYTFGMAFDAVGRLYISDTYNNRVRRISNGLVETVAGNGTVLGDGFTGTFSGDGGPATSAALNQPMAVLPDANGNLFIADYGNFRIRKVTHLYTPVTRDFDGTGRSSLLLYDRTGGSAYSALTNGDGTYRYAAGSFTPGFDTLRSGDFNGDGKADLVVYNSHTALSYIGFSNGDGSFAFQSLFWSPAYDFVEPGDLDGDNRTDFALYNSATGTMYTAISNGTGTFTYKYTLISKGYTFLRLADFTGDGKADIFLYNASSGATFIGIGDGLGGFAFQPLFVSPGYNLTDSGDLNGDGKSDLILYNGANGNAATAISDGSGAFTFNPMPFSPGFTSVRLADYTGDGKSDVTLYNKSTGAAYFGTGTGTGTFNFQSLFWSPGYDAVEPQDVNGDGRTDVVLYNSLTGTEYTGISNGNGTYTYTYQYWGIGRMLAK